MSPHAAFARDAILSLHDMIARPASTIELRVWDDGNTFTVPHTIERGSAQKLADRISRYEERYAYEITIALPRKQPGWGTADPSRVLWCRIEGSDSYERAKRFRPHPSLVLQEGASSRRWLFWPLEQSLTWVWCVKANKRIAYRLGGVQKHADPDLLEIPCPGTFLRSGRSKPCPVRVARIEPEFYTARQVVGGLKDPPEPKSWWDRQAS